MILSIWPLPLSSSPRSAIKGARWMCWVVSMSQRKLIPQEMWYWCFRMHMWTFAFFTPTCFKQKHSPCLYIPCRGALIRKRQLCTFESGFKGKEKVLIHLAPCSFPTLIIFPQSNIYHRCFTVNRERVTMCWCHCLQTLITVTDYSVWHHQEVWICMVWIHATLSSTPLSLSMQRHRCLVLRWHCVHWRKLIYWVSITDTRWDVLDIKMHKFTVLHQDCFEGLLRSMRESMSRFWSSQHILNFLQQIKFHLLITYFIYLVKNCTKLTYIPFLIICFIK